MSCSGIAKFNGSNNEYTYVVDENKVHFRFDVIEFFPRNGSLFDEQDKKDFKKFVADNPDTFNFLKRFLPKKIEGELGTWLDAILPNNLHVVQLVDKGDEIDIILTLSDKSSKTYTEKKNETDGGITFNCPNQWDHYEYKNGVLSCHDAQGLIHELQKINR